MSERKPRKSETGTVTSDKMDKTITVRAEKLIEHPQFKKRVKRFRVFKAHDENNEAKIGDVVEIAQTRPLSKTKNWRLARIIQKDSSGESAR